MISGAQIPRRIAVGAAITLSLLLVWTTRLRPFPWERPAQMVYGPPDPPAHVVDYLEQAYSVAEPAPGHYQYTGLREACDHMPAADDDTPFLNCVGMVAGITSIVAQVKVCLKMAVDTGSHLVLPRMPLRSSEDLTAFNFLNDEAYMAYDEWFDADHLRRVLGRACPRMRIVHPAELEDGGGGGSIEVKHRWSVSVDQALGYRKAQSYFWTGRPFKNWFDEQYLRLRFLNNANPNKDPIKRGITVVNIDSEFLLFRITDDPTGRELHLWNDLSHLVRFREQPRQIVHNLLQKLPRPYYGVHFRVENDTIWSSLENQLKVDLDALDLAWNRFGKPGLQKPLVYLACGDQVQVEKFVEAGAARGWEVTHKWKLAKDDPATTQMINSLAFDFQGVVDMGIMVRAQFFFGITGSAFSSTIAHLRDVTGRYRGSSFDVWDDEGAASHLFFEGDTQYACCL
ncbi:hypothetical protein JX266_010125 [Neoarthrinium moseri]|nr:hypothetical protein JX266_010125 [Neoarthrinium moseri]